MDTRFQILGPFRVTDADGAEIPLGGEKPAALLAMLVLRANELVAADRLIEDLWDGQPPATAAKTLQVHISRLRRALPENTIETTRGGYVLNAVPEQIDAQRFEALVSDGTAALAEGAHARASARLRSALALWRGDALADFTYASFAQDTIARLDGLRTVALESAVEAELALGRHAELVPEIKSLLKRHPLSEHLHAQLMLALYRSGRQAEALGVYRAARRVLVDQLGIEPSEELRELERRILEQDAELAAPRPQARSVPGERPSRGSLVGYEQELASLEDRLEQALIGHGDLALISGEPGIGKSRLADELGAVAQARGARVVWGRCSTAGGAPAYWPWIQVLRSFGAELRDVVGDAADSDDQRFALHDAATTFITKLAAERPLLIVLDDLHAADASSLALLQFAAASVPAAPVMIVGTYRDTEEALEPELRDTISELARATDCLQLVLTGMSADDTAHFVEVSAGVAPMPALSAAIHQASSGNPLFVTELVRLLRAEDRLHEITDDTPLTLPRGVDQVIARRVARLSEGCREVLAAGAVIGRDLDERLLQQVLGRACDEQLDEAVRARLVDPSGGNFRFSHDLVRQTLQAALPAGERRRLNAATAAALEQSEPAPTPAVVARLAHYYAEALPEGDAGKAVFYLSAAGDNAADFDACEEASSWYAKAVDLARANDLDDSLVCELYTRLAEQLVLVPDPARARAALAAAEEIAGRGVPDKSLDARIALATVHVSCLDAQSATRERLYAAVEFFQEIDDPLGEARAWDALAVLHCGYSEKTQEGYAGQRMLEVARRAGNRGLVNRAMGAIAASLASGTVPVSEAIPRVKKMGEEARDPITRARLKTALAVLYGASGRFDEARATLAEGEALAPASERLGFQTRKMSWTARLELLARNYKRAEEIARELCAIWRSQNLVGLLCSEQMFLVDALIGQGRLAEAAAELESAPAGAPDDTDAQFRQARSRAALELARGELDAAEEHARLATGYTDGSEAPDEQCQTLLVLAEVLIARGCDDEAREVLEESLAFSTRRENVVLTERARELLAATERVAA
jgi:DNA-binding SARP family transcriptional activator